MSIEQCFLRDIIDHPTDDTPRLIFADWLDDNGQPERAEFIRVQCKIEALTAEAMDKGEDCQSPRCAICAERRALRRRENELLFNHWPRWLHNAFDGLAYDMGASARDNNDFGVSLYDAQSGELGHFDCFFRRGFVSLVSCLLPVWLAHGAAIIQAQPIERVELPGIIRHLEGFPTIWRGQGDGDVPPLLFGEISRICEREFSCERCENRDHIQAGTHIHLHDDVYAKDVLSRACLALAHGRLT